MLKNCLGNDNVTNMQKYAGLLIVTCLCVCFTFISSFPLRRDLSKFTRDVHPNLTHETLKCDLTERTKKKASNLENTLHRIKDSTQDIGKSIYDHINTGIKSLANKDTITEDEIRYYEELVIMKKYPYLDLKAFEMKYSPHISKNARHRAAFSMDQSLQNEPGAHCDPVEDSLNVEIINRGLSGFAIPLNLAKQADSTDRKVINTVEGNSNNVNGDVFSKILVTSNYVLKSLKDDINTYIERKRLE